jgi:hypothetical protein
MESGRTARDLPPKEDDMIRFFHEGGFAMYPVLVVGLLLFGASIRYAIDAEPIRRSFINAMALALVAITLFATWIGLAAVFRYMETVKEPEFASTLMTGLKEVSHNGLLGGMLLTVSLILTAVGTYRAGRRELKALREG